jgi:hypothetical protein
MSEANSASGAYKTSTAITMCTLGTAIAATLKMKRFVGRRTGLPGARRLYKNGRALPRSRICMCGAARSNCHKLALSHLAADRGKAASMPAAARLYCIFHARYLGMLAFDDDPDERRIIIFGLCRW